MNNKCLICGELLKSRQKKLCNSKPCRIEYGRVVAKGWWATQWWIRRASLSGATNDHPPNR